MPKCGVQGAKVTSRTGEKKKGERGGVFPFANEMALWRRRAGHTYKASTSLDKRVTAGLST